MVLVRLKPSRGKKRVMNSEGYLDEFSVREPYPTEELIGVIHVEREVDTIFDDVPERALAPRRTQYGDTAINLEESLKWRTGATRSH